MPSLCEAFPLSAVPMPATDAELGDGWRYGTHWSSPGRSGYIIHHTDGTTARVQERPDIYWAEDDDAGPEDCEPDEVSVSMVLDGVRAAAGRS